MKVPVIALPIPLKIGTLSRWEQDEFFERAEVLRAGRLSRLLSSSVLKRAVTPVLPRFKKLWFQFG